MRYLFGEILAVGYIDLIWIYVGGAISLGVLIISMLIIPAAAARSLAWTPERMAMMAVLLVVLSVTGGLGASLQWDTASGPSIVVVAFGLFLLARAFASPRWQKSGSES